MAEKIRQHDACVVAGECPINRAAVHGAPTPCVNGKSGEYDCNGIDMLSFVPIASLGSTYDASDSWGELRVVRSSSLFHGIVARHHFFGVDCNKFSLLRDLFLLFSCSVLRYFGTSVLRCFCPFFLLFFWSCPIFSSNPLPPKKTPSLRQTPPSQYHAPLNTTPPSNNIIKVGLTLRLVMRLPSSA